MGNESVATKKYFWYELEKKIDAFAKKIKFDQWKGWIYLSPAIVLLLIFTVWPIFNTVRMSLLEGYTTMMEVSGATFKLGIGNFVRVLKYPGFLTCLKNTVLLTVLTVPISTFLALLIAVCLNSIKLFSRALQTIFFLPYVTNSIAIGMVFAAMFNMIIGGSARPDSVGIVNNVIDAVLGRAPLYAAAKDGIHGVELANAMHLSSWLDKDITLPIDEDLFLEELNKRIATSKPHKVIEKTEIQG